MKKVFFPIVILSCILLVSCSQKTSRRLSKKKDKKDHRGVEGLTGGRKALYENLVNLTKESRTTHNLYEPINGDTFTYNITFKNSVRQNFNLNNSNKKCLFEYNKMRIEESTFKENDSYFMSISKTPINALYIGIPLEDRKKQCLKEIAKLEVSKDKVLIDLKEKAAQNDKSIRDHFLSLVKNCKEGKTIKGLGKCQGLDVFSFEERADGRREGDSIYNFSGELDINKKKYPINIVFSLRDIYWGFGGLIGWDSQTGFYSEVLKNEISIFQSVSIR